MTLYFPCASEVEDAEARAPLSIPELVLEESLGSVKILSHCFRVLG